MRRLSLLLIGLVLLAGLPEARAAEVPPYTLLTFDESRPWRAVGRVNVTDTRRRVMCTGTLIAPDVVLTAAHCLVSRRNGASYNPRYIHFVTGWHKGRKTGHSVARAVAFHPDWTGKVVKAQGDVGTDLALLRLERPIKARSAEPFEIGVPPLPGEPVTLLSYRRDRAHALTRQDNCRYRAMIDAVMALDCNVIHGASGAPVFAEIDGKPRIVAVLAAMTRRQAGKQPQAFAARIDQVIAELLELLD